MKKSKISYDKIVLTFIKSVDFKLNRTMYTAVRCLLVSQYLWRLC